jgi:gluconokinase
MTVTSPPATRSAVPRVVVVMGVSGSGKSTVGAALADRLGVPFADGDDLHPAANIAKMAAGRPLTDGDRAPWLEAVGHWLAGHAGSGGVITCSALKRSYRDLLRSFAPDADLVHLHGRHDVIARRQAARPGHFMPPALLDSQFATLEPLDTVEAGLVLDVDGDVSSIVDRYLAHHRPAPQPHHPQPHWEFRA